MIRRILNYLLLAALLAVTVISAGLEILKFWRQQ